MADLILEPYSATQHWQLSNVGDRWGTIVGEYLQTIAQRCTEAGDGVIGHIKALALFSDESYLRVSVISPDIPANIEGATPSGCTELDLTLNVLVYGLERKVIEDIAQKAATEAADHFKGNVITK